MYNTFDFFSNGLIKLKTLGWRLKCIKFSHLFLKSKFNRNLPKYLTSTKTLNDAVMSHLDCILF